MKKLFALILALAMVFALAACTDETEVVTAESAAPQTAAPEASTEPSPEAAIPAQPTAEDIAALSTALDDLTASVRPGSSGCSLRAVISAAELLDWGSATAMDSEQISAAVTDWTADKDEATLSIFKESLLSVSDTCQQLRQENAPDLLDSAGCMDSGYPWSDAAYAAAQAVFDAAEI